MNTLLPPRLTLAALLLGAFLPDAVGTSMTPLSVAELEAESDLVLHGRVRAIATSRNQSGRIISRVRVEPIEVWKGTAPESGVVVTLAGGVLGTCRVVVDGQPEYRPGEEVVLFLKRNPLGEAVTVGLAQGKFEVETDPATGRPHAQNLFFGGIGREARTIQRFYTRAPTTRITLPLAALKQEVVRTKR